MTTNPSAEQPPGLGPEIWKRENELKQVRRSFFGTSADTPARPVSGDTIGFALSGGGIRSATFCLGVFQALARLRLLHAIDYLSTVSGGGYFGSFWTAWLNRQKGRSHFEHVERSLAESASREVRWLRENGRYLAPNGSMDAFAGLAVHLRNFVAIHLSLGFYWLALFGFLNAALLALGTTPVEHVLPYHYAPSMSVPVVSALWILALVLVGALFLVGTIYFWTPASPVGADQRNRLSKWLTKLLILVIVVAVVGLVDAAARLLFNTGGDLKPLLSVVSATAFASVGRKLYQWLEPLFSRPKEPMPLTTLTTVGAAALAAIWLVGYDWLAFVLAARIHQGVDAVLPLAGSSACLGAGAGLLALLCNWNRRLAFLNLSSHATLYAARLTRTYHGASNPQRHPDPHKPDASPAPVTDLLDSDVVPYATFEPTESGGPIHVVNVTINETLDGRSQTEQRDRHGLPLAIGPAGMSVGVRHHAYWEPASARTILKADAPPAGYAVWGNSDAKIAAQSRTLGEWIAISGAAFTTGLGAQTNRALSFLLGFANVRLGYWWNSGVSTPPAKAPTLAARVKAVHRALLPVQTGLLSEFLARFRGPQRRTWYLSDGGHFENTAAYELIRRQLPFIVICDCGCDPSGEFEDFGNLVRKARIDFRTEITVCSDDELVHWIPNQQRRRHFTTNARFAAASSGQEVHAPGHAVLATIRYPDGSTGMLLLLKPSLTGDEPVDVLHYDRAQPAFPQEPTSDQFFDEAQWESYRKLGEHIAMSVFETADPGLPHWGLSRP